LEALKNFNALDNPARTAEYLEIAQHELRRLTLMTDKILKTSVFETRGVDLEFDDVEFDMITEQVISSLKLLLERRKMQLHYHKIGTDFNLHGAEEHLTNVLYNLVDNAVKYSADGSSINIRLQEQGSVITLTVEDNGLGIAKEYHGKIFEKFFRVPSGDLHNIKGYGLGLSYVAGVIRNHNGKISLESEPGSGSKFIVTLPKKHVD
jgi:signal transduction histidine kinase